MYSRKNTLIFFLCTLCGAMTLIAQQPDINLDEMSFFEMEKERYIRRANFTPNAFTADYDVVYHRLEWIVDPSVQYIEGKVTTYFRPTVDGFQSIHFDFSDSLICKRATYHNQEVNFEAIGDHTLAIDFPEEVPNGVLDSIVVEYEGEPRSSGFSSFNADTHNDIPVLWTLSEPYGARDWWPCKQNLTDKIDSVDIYVTCPDMYKVASNGLLKKVEELGNGQHRYFWSHRYPITAYLIAIGVTDYEVFSQFVDLPSGDSLEILNYVYPESRERAETDLVHIIPMMELFNELFGLYPFAEEKYGHAQFGFGGGMEHQTMSFMGGYSFELQAHELAHQWFGNKVTCGSWQDIWLNEGFATYLTGVSIEHLSTKYWYGWKRGNRDRIVSEPGGSTYVRDTSGIGTIFSSRLSYSKGAFILHQLRWLLGDDVFYRACRAFLTDQDLSFGYARSADFQRVFESIADTSLTEYFSDYLYGAGYPSFQLKWQHINDSLYLELDQLTSDPSVDFFEMAVPVRIYHAGDSSDIIINHENQNQRWVQLWQGSVDSLKVDPDIWLISKDNVVTEAMLVGNQSTIEDVAEVLPNPFNDLLIIKKMPAGTKSLVVRDVAGNMVHSVHTTNREVRIPTETWPVGAYHLHLTVGDQRYSGITIKQ